MAHSINAIARRLRALTTDWLVGQSGWCGDPDCCGDTRRRADMAAASKLWDSQLSRDPDRLLQALIQLDRRHPLPVAPAAPGRQGLFRTSSTAGADGYVLVGGHDGPRARRMVWI